MAYPSIYFGCGQYVAPLGPTLTYITNVQDSTSLTTYTFTNVNIGTAAADRLVVVACHAEEGSGSFNATVSSVTIGGVAATEVVDRGTGNIGAALYALRVTSGTTATIVVTYTEAPMNRCLIATYTITGQASDTAAASGSGTNTITLTFPDDSVGIAASSSKTWVAASWTNITERYDLDMTGGTGATGGDIVVSTGGNLALSLTGPTTANSTVAACWA